MKLKTWHWVAIIIVVGGLITWAVIANQNKRDAERLEALRNQGGSSAAPTGSNLSTLLNAIFPFFEKSVDTVKK